MKENFYMKNLQYLILFTLTTQLIASDKKPTISLPIPSQSTYFSPVSPKVEEKCCTYGCGASFSAQINLEYHEKTCTKNFKSKGKKGNKSSQIPAANSIVFPLNPQDQSSPKRSEESRFSCFKCRKTFSNAKKRNAHVTTCSGKKPGNKNHTNIAAQMLLQKPQQ